ncbi:sugar ABC transporter permease [Streptomyces sp. adm13(2018)]|uniref:sugar ABC transporter permease n=1 Tax=Streptomyces sp. adm13(2018) TaxID=2479007 RepID=UPI0011CD756B|nr:sugar ABC transporter permease [Streptomyces sp. adm13(2018)]TXS19214.1 sugar ABC transporter permease [Streptomyces sp. adm13(2018)]
MRRDRGRDPSGGSPDAGSQEPASGAVPAVDTRLLVREEGIKGYLGEFRRRMRSGELGSLPVVLAVIIIWTVFGSLNSTFLSAQNLSDLSQQIVGTGMIAVGIVFVLLLGEIDLSVGSVSGLCAAIFAVLNVLNGMNEWLALLVAIAGGAAVGLIQGFFFAKVGVPAFVVTLAGNLAWNGLMLQVLGTSGTVNIPSESIVSRLYSTIYHSPAAAYVAAAVGVGLFLAASLLDAQRRRAARVPFRPLSEIVLRTVVIAALAFATAYILNQYRGLPLALLIFLVLLVVLDFVLRRTTYGRRIFAVGGNIEGARRAGISVPFVRMTVFSIAGTMAAVGGLFLAGQIQSASQTSGGGNLLMNVIAAAVIGGTSLFGGRGTVWSALLGALVIGSIQSGMNIMGVSNAVQFMITGAVLLAAVVVDSLSRRSQKAAGRA